MPAPPIALFAATLLVTTAGSALQARTLPIPNPSFESPTTAFADPRIDSWQKAPKPFWYDESLAPWDQLAGVFANTAPGGADHIVNMDGGQGSFLFALPTVALFQDRDSSPTHDFDVTFRPGRSYQLTVGVLGGGGGMTNGVTLELSVYYRDASGNPVTVARTTVTNSAEAFPTRTQLTDFTVSVPTVRTDAPWAGRNLGVQILSTVAPNLAGGYWDVDNVRLTETIEVPNASFESPTTAFADPRVDSWEKAPKPFWYDESLAPWDQLVGVFANTAPGSADHIVNMHGSQGSFFFALPTVALFQDSNSSPTHDFDVAFEAGHAYELTVGLLGGGGGMTNGVTIELSVYYRDAASNQLAVASTTVTHTAETFPTRTQFTDFTVRVPTVRAGDPWAGKNLGIQILSTVLPNLAGGYWDIDNVRLSETLESVPVLLNPSLKEGRFSFTLQSTPGLKFTIEAASAPVAPAPEWTALGTVTNTTGQVPFVDSAPPPARRFYRARLLP